MHSAQLNPAPTASVRTARRQAWPGYHDLMAIIRRRYRIQGVVQGVGFRPHVARTAASFPVTGFVGNDDAEVFLEAQATPSTLDAFLSAVRSTLPPLATISLIDAADIPTVTSETDFRIVKSQRKDSAPTLIPPDVAICPECLAEMRDPTNRRYQYPFTTCTHCGPRLSIIESLPYDRPNTTMRVFPMCPQCQEEYTNPLDRRYHAQPISCPDCGPRLWWADSSGGEIPVADPIAAARDALAEGAIVAVKGLGGFHLMCDARNAATVARLRHLKRRPTKPFALMAPDLESARHVAHLTPEEEALLESPAHPIVIAPAAGTSPGASTLTTGTASTPAVETSHPGSSIPEGIAPGLDRVGVMLPYTPLHVLLVDRLLVATSGNLSGEPLCYRNEEGVDKLGGMTDYFLMHDRPIHLPVEDSVCIGTTPERRSRGYAPLPICLPLFSPPGEAVLAVGGELKNTCAVAEGTTVFLSSHNGDMGSLASQQACEKSARQLVEARRVTPSLVVCDAHPGYSTSAWAQRYAEEQDIALLRVFHHHAHALSLLAEHQVSQGPAVIATLDGTGYGPDGSIWGGEILSFSEDLRQWERAWHVPTFDLVGGDNAVMHPGRIVAGINHAWGLDLPIPTLSHWEREFTEAQLRSGVGVVTCSSLGRLFDAAGVLLGFPDPSYDAEMAMRVQAAALRQAQGGINQPEHGVAPAETCAEALVRLADTANTWQFHQDIGHIIGSALEAESQKVGAPIVGITGGCALNDVLVSAIERELSVPLLQHKTVPPGDGGLALGQIMAAAVRFAPGRSLH